MLKLCPFCGSKETKIIKEIAYNIESYYGKCEWCGAKGEICLTKLQAEECWNHRVGE